MELPIIATYPGADSLLGKIFAEPSVPEQSIWHGWETLTQHESTKLRTKAKNLKWKKVHITDLL